MYLWSNKSVLEMSSTEHVNRNDAYIHQLYPEAMIVFQKRAVEQHTH